MASTVKPGDPEYISSSSPALASVDYFKYDAILRFLLFVSTLVAAVTIATSNQTEVIPPQPTPHTAKFSYSPAFLYYVAALSVTGIYSIVTILASVFASNKPALKTKLLLHFILWDTLILGIIASATGAAGAIGYFGLKGNRHVMGWHKICPVYDKFCRHASASVGVALFGGTLTILLIWLSAYTIHTRLPN